MARKARLDRASVATHVVALRLTSAERAALDELVRRQNGHLRKLRFAPVVTRATYLRSLLSRELEALGLQRPDDGNIDPAEDLTLVPPRKRPRRTTKKMPGTVTVERTVSLTLPEQDVNPTQEIKPRRTVWERIVTGDMFDDEQEKK